MLKTWGGGVQSVWRKMVNNGCKAFEVRKQERLLKTFIALWHFIKEGQLVNKI